MVKLVVIVVIFILLFIVAFTYSAVTLIVPTNALADKSADWNAGYTAGFSDAQNHNRLPCDAMPSQYCDGYIVGYTTGASSTGHATTNTPTTSPPQVVQSTVAPQPPKTYNLGAIVLFVLVVITVIAVWKLKYKGGKYGVTAAMLGVAIFISFFIVAVTYSYGSSNLPLILFVLVVIFIGAVAWKIKPRGGKYRERQYFPESVMQNILEKQHHKCAHCNKLLNVVDYDHKNGDRSNNKESNCIALCPNCHAVKTRGLGKNQT